MFGRRKTARQKAASKRNLARARKRKRKKPKYGYSPSGKYVGTRRSGRGKRARRRSR